MNVLIFGIGKFAEYVSYAINDESNYKICGYCVDKTYMPSSKKFLGLPVCDFETVEKNFSPDDYKLFIALGYHKIKSQKINSARKKGFELISFVSKKTNVYDDLSIGDNVFIGEDSAIQSNVSIGDGSIIIAGRIGHHCHLGKNILLSCATLGANTTVKEGSFFGLNSIVKPNTIIGKRNIIGMQAMIKENTTDDAIYQIRNTTFKRDVPASRIGDKYLK